MQKGIVFDQILARHPDGIWTWVSMRNGWWVECQPVDDVLPNTNKQTTRRTIAHIRGFQEAGEIKQLLIH